MRSCRHVGVLMLAVASQASDTMEKNGDDMTMYVRFAISLGASLVAMFFLAFSQIDAFKHFEWSLSVFWITLSMVSMMGLVMLTAMGSMLPHKRLNLVLYAVFALLLVSAFTAGRFEAGVGDDAFLSSMIPHHSRAIHMCQEAALQDPEIRDLCQQIIETQREEIDQMYDIMERRG